MMSAELATLGLLQIKVIWNKIYDVIMSLYDITNKILSRNSDYIIEVVMWPNFGNSFLWEKLSKHQFIRIWLEKPIFWGVLLVEVQ